MTIPYVVRRGDTLRRIAERLGVMPEMLSGVNPEVCGTSGLSPGQVLQVPRTPSARYIIQAGDTFRDLAARFGIDMPTLLEANPQSDPRRLRIGQTVVIPSAAADIPPVGKTGDLDYDYMTYIRQLHRLKQTYPFLEMGTIGTTVLGRPIPFVRIGSGLKEVHYNGAIHANEWITSLLLTRFLETYADAVATGGSLCGADARTLFDHTSLWLVPMVNPDGVELTRHGAPPDSAYYDRLLAWNGGPDFSGWKANIRGVDLNDQFPAGWEIERARRAVDGPGPRDYTGEEPLSEPEAAALASFTRSRDFRRVMAFHTQGEEIYWNYRNSEPPEAEAMAERLGAVSGYLPVKLEDSDAGYKDWFIQEYRRPGFTIEAGLGVNPLPISQLDDIYKRTEPLMIEGLLL